MRVWLSIVAVLIFTVALSSAEEKMSDNMPGEQEKCPVCGMFVAKYSDFRAKIVFKDGSHAYFCGVKDMMKYHFDLPKYNPSQKPSDVARITVTDYKDMKPTDGYEAYYVMGSVVFGPMGQEFFPFREESAAREFLQENRGKEIVRFHQINSDLLKDLLRKY